jgi:hypothetical protein
MELVLLVTLSTLLLQEEDSAFTALVPAQISDIASLLDSILLLLQENIYNFSSDLKWDWS